MIPHQPSLFSGCAGQAPAAELTITPKVLQAWQAKVRAHQLTLRSERACQQPSLFSPAPGSAQISAAADNSLDPFSLPPQNLHFWRWPDPPHQGAALYFVLDHSDDATQALLLYVGETCQADRRWKRDHDCKNYLAAYAETLVRCGITPCFSIRFWCDAPANARARRSLEQQQIRHWLPPFNKEYRQRWQTPFQSEGR
jgi:hypothetical protein